MKFTIPIMKISKKDLLGLLVISAFAFSLPASGADTEAKLPTAEAFSKGTLEESSAAPKGDAGPQVCWQWMNGHISKEGLTADIDAMAKNGISGLMMYAIGMEEPGPVPLLSDQWLELFLHTVSEADRRGIKIGVHNGLGWSASGGPWIDAEHNMQILTTSRVYLEGDGKEQVVALPQPWTNLNYYRDERVIAFPSGPVMADATPVITASNPIDGNLLTDGRPDTQVVIAAVAEGQQRFVQMEFPEPFTAEGLWLTHFGSQPTGGGEVEVSDDGTNFRSVGAFEYAYHIHHNGGQSQTTFAPVSGRFFRVRFHQPGGDFGIGEVELAMVPTLKAILPKAGYFTPSSVPGFSSFSYEWGASRDDGPTVDSKQVLDLSQFMDKGNLKWTPPPGRWTVMRVGHTASGVEGAPLPSNVRGLEVDKLSKSAVKIHYDGYVGRLAKLCGPLTGKSFTDVINDSWEVGSQNWTAGLHDEFRKRRGYDMVPFLPLLLTGRVVDSVEISERFIEDFRRTLQELILDDYFGYYTELCHQDGLRYWVQNYNGVFCDTLDIAGKVDAVWGEFWSNYAPDQFLSDNHWYAKHASSGSQVYGSKLVPAESFTAHLDRWTKSPKTLKAKGDLIYCGGVNQFVMHISAHQPWLDRFPGMTRGPNGIMFDRNNTWWDLSAEWVRYLRRCQAVLQQGAVVGDIVCLMPKYEPKSTSAVLKAYYEMGTELPRGIDYVFVPEDGLVQKAQVADGSIRFPLGEGYRLMILPDNATSSPELLGKIREMLESGVTVYAKRRPDRARGLHDNAVRDAEIQKLAAEIWGDVDGTQVTSRKVGKGLLIQGMPLPDALRLAGIRPDFDFANVDGSPVQKYEVAGNVRQLNSIHRRADGCEVYFVANHTPEKKNLVCRFRVTGMTPERWDPVTGKIEKLAAFRELDGMTELPLQFGPSESTFIVFRPVRKDDPVVSMKRDGKELFPAFATAGEAAPEPGAPVWALTTDDSGKFNLRSAAAGNFTATTASGKSWTQSIPTLPAPQLVPGPWKVDFEPGRGAPATAQFPALTSWSDHEDEGIRYFSGNAVYRTTVSLAKDLLIPERHILLNLGNVEVIAQVKINGKDCGILWYDPFQVEVTDALKPGDNELEIRVANLWPNRMIGDLRNPAKPPITFSQTQWFTAADQLLPSGLLGPVELRTVARLPATGPP